MKKYRFKIDTPWGKKGDEIPRDPDGMCSRFCTHIARDSEYELFPEIFEPIEEKTPEQKIIKWMCNNVLSINGSPRFISEIAARELIAAGLDPDKLEISK